MHINRCNYNYTTMISNTQTKENIPWVEKYRATHIDDIVLDSTNRQIFKNIIDNNCFPNLMFYGPPGTGKTTTIINLINEYQTKYTEINKCSVIHLNASDERGIDIIRNHIYQFVKSKNFFEAGLKFVILDEVDYMTKNAQQALKFLLQSSTYNVRFCLICNYISKIDDSLKNEFICIRFNQLPKNDIYTFINQIAINEKLNIDRSSIDTIQQLYNSDIRSMINFLQLNQNITDWKSTVITDIIWENIHTLLTKSGVVEVAVDSTEDSVINYIYRISIQYNIDKKNIIKKYFNYIIRNKKVIITPELLYTIEGIMHTNDSNVDNILQYFAVALNALYETKN